MTKQKVWFEKKPEFRDECPFFVYGEHLHYCRLKEVNIFDDKDKCTSCPLQSIKTHNRELVKEVCEKIKYKLGAIEDILINLGNGKEDALNYFTHILNEIEKEHEK